MRPYFWLRVPEADTRYRIIAIDPGTNTMGVSILTLDLQTKIIEAEYVTTLVAEDMLTPYEGMLLYYGERFTKLYALQVSLTYLMNQFQIHAVVSEAPYLGRFPQAFAALTETMCSIRSAILNYNPYTHLTTIDPATVKTNVGVSGKSNDKMQMRNAIINLWNQGLIKLVQGVDIYQLDEHSIDSLAVGYSKLRLMV